MTNFVSESDNIMDKFNRNNYASTYGELTREGLHKLLSKINTRNKVFYDLGSGKGNVVKYAAEDFPKLKKCKGVELHDDRHNEAVANVEGHQNQNKIEYYNDDILSHKIQDGDIFYVSNLCFPQEVNEKLYTKLHGEMKPGSCIFCSKPLTHSKPSNVNTTVKQTWWDASDIYKYIKTSKGLMPINSPLDEIKAKRKTQRRKLKSSTKKRRPGRPKKYNKTISTR